MFDLYITLKIFFDFPDTAAPVACKQNKLRSVQLFTIFGQYAALRESGRKCQRSCSHSEKVWSMFVAEKFVKNIDKYGTSNFLAPFDLCLSRFQFLIH